MLSDDTLKARFYLMRQLFYRIGAFIIYPLQSALNSCVAGDTIIVSPGMYLENIIWPNKSGIYLKSKTGSGSTVINGRQRGSVITINVNVDLSSTIDGFTIQNGNAGIGGGGVLCENSNPTISYNIISPIF